MKFTDGYWQMREGVTGHFAAAVHELIVEPDALTVYEPTKRIVTRGDTLNLPLITVRFSAPLPNVIRVQIWHHKGGRARPPEFTLAPAAHDIQIADGEQAAKLTSGALTVRVRKAGGWRVEFMAGDRVLTSSDWRAAGFVDTSAGRLSGG